MYWINVIAELLNINVDVASKVYERMFSFDFSEASDTEIKNEAKLIILIMKG